ncbi:SDR family NAD(P)-dependent oxidoreductase [Pseudonocardia xishanensis]|uniref:SDR family oxidoreductase n=1 Tax=Pseudonocardia xishanensis TaxID=630995 RepID=A0ABP8RHQ3_9PSEU
MDLGLTDRVAIVTGAGGGIGAATARILRDEGCRVLAVDRAPGGVEALERESDGSVVAHVADIVDEAAATGIGPAAVEHFGRLDIVATCAGVVGSMDSPALHEETLENWDRTVDINLRGTFLTVKGSMPFLVEAGWGRVVTVGSVAGQVGSLSAGPAYGASKAGVLGLTRWLAKQVGPHGVTVNCVHPGTVVSPMTEAQFDAATFDARAKATLLGRNGEVEELGSVIAFLASAQAAYITGAHIDVNGGLYMG